MKIWKQCELKKNHLSMTKSSLSRHLVNLKVLPTSKALKLSTSLSLTSKTKLLCSDAQTEVEHMYDELRQSFETFQQNIYKLTLNVKL